MYEGAENTEDLPLEALYAEDLMLMAENEVSLHEKTGSQRKKNRQHVEKIQWDVVKQEA